MAFTFTEDCQRGVDLAKRSLAKDGDTLSTAAVLAGILHASRMKDLLPELLPHVPEPRPLRETAQSAALSDGLRGILCEVRDRLHPNPISSAALFAAMVKSPEGRAALTSIPAPDLARVENKLAAEVLAENQGAKSWKDSPKRQEAFKALEDLGRVLTRSEPKGEPMTGRERELHSLVRVLCKIKRHNAIIAGEAGSGKTALVRELARRIFLRDARLPQSILELDIFELEPMRLKAGASMVGEYEKRMRDLVGILRGARNIVLFIDEIHAFFQSSTGRSGPFSDTHESLKAELARGEIACIGCTTLKEYRHFIEPDAALARRFAMIRIEPPDRTTTLGIVQKHKQVLEAHFKLSIPDTVTTQAVDASELYLPTRFQPDKSLQLLEDACAFAYTETPPAPQVGEQHIRLAVEDIIGHTAIDPLNLREDELYAKLREKIVGQDEPLRTLSHGVVMGLHGMTGTKGPLRVFVFAGPSGVGKTETALKLSEILGAGRRALVQVDCNTLWDAQGDGIKSRLFGPAPGYVGYSEGKGGLLSRVRDFPYSVLLFDEFEKGPAALADILLEILDKGQVEDNSGNLLDFRRSIVVFATNVGWHGEPRTRQMGFPNQNAKLPAKLSGPNSKEAIQEALKQTGLSDAFLGRLRDGFLFFSPLGPEAVEKAIERLFGVLREALKRRNLTLSWKPDVIPYLTKHWEPRFGVRHLKVLIENRITEHLSLAEMDGELKGVKQICIEVAPPRQNSDDDVSQARTQKRREGDFLILTLT